MVVREACPACGSKRFKRNGHLQTGQQNHQCKACSRQFVLQADNRVIGEEQRTLVERLLREKISLHGICRAVGVSIRWLMGFAQFIVATRGRQVDCLASYMDQTCCSISSILRRCAGRQRPVQSLRTRYPQSLTGT
jgi:hypothetical protein